MERIVGDKQEITKIDAQLEDFKSWSKCFGREVAKTTLNTKTLAQWWDYYEHEYLELQRFAIHVLSLTCSSSRCEHNQSMFEMITFKLAINMIHISILELVAKFYMLIDFIFV